MGTNMFKKFAQTCKNISINISIHGKIICTDRLKLLKHVKMIWTDRFKYGTKLK